MKRIGNLYDKIISLGNLRLADEKARRGKTNTYGVKVHDKNREANLLALHDALLTKTYRTSEYDVFTIYEPKERIIYRLPYFPDRIVHHAVMNILEPIWVSIFTHNTYSCIKGRGIEGCARQVGKIIKAFDGQPLYCLKIDIRKFYPSIRHDVIKQLIRRKIKDINLLWLLDEIIDSVSMDMNGRPVKGYDKAHARGVPIGNYLSQYLANLCLCYFMHWANEEMPKLIQKALCLKDKPRIEVTEYADDIVFFAASKEVLHEALRLSRGKLECELGFKIKDNYQIFPVSDNRYDNHGRALDYVGYKFYRHQKLIRKGIKHNFCRTVIRFNRRSPPMSAEAYKQGICSWLGWVKHSDSKHLVKTIIKKDYYESIL